VLWKLIHDCDMRQEKMLVLATTVSALKLLPYQPLSYGLELLAYEALSYYWKLIHTSVASGKRRC
jgi:hypothetical protein